MTDDAVTDDAVTDDAVTNAPAPGRSDEPAAFTVVRGNPTPGELAAVTAVITALAEELEHQRMPAETPRAHAWERSARRLRDRIVPGPGAWNAEKF